MVLLSRVTPCGLAILGCNKQGLHTLRDDERVKGGAFTSFLFVLGTNGRMQPVMCMGEQPLESMAHVGLPN